MKTSSFCTRLYALAATALLVFAAVMPLHAQTSAGGNITGTVTDATGAIVPNAAVVIINTDTGVTRTLTTNAAGEYSAPFLQPGHYEVILGGGNFGKIDRKNLVLTVGQTLSIDAALAVGTTSTEVSVSSDTPILDPDKTEVSQTIGQHLIENLPVASRNWSAFVLNTPNVVQDGGSGLVSFRGISGLYNQNYVDGANNNQMLFSEARGRASGAPYVYSLDAIKEFQAETSNYSVEFGQAAGGQVNAITKSGTNAIHGDLFYDLRYPALNALDPYNKYQALHNGGNSFLLTQPIHQQQQFGGSVGGPIIKDRLFYFFTYDGFRRVGKVLFTDSNNVTQTATAGNSGGSNISPTQCPTYIPTGSTTPVASVTATQCASAINFILANAVGAPGRFAKQNLFFPRLDFHINHANDMFVDYNFADFDSTYGYNAANTFSNSSPSTNAPTSYHERFLVGGLTTQVSSRAINQVHFQYGRDLETAGANSPGPSIGMGVFTYGMNVGLPRRSEPDEHRTQFTDVFSFTKGRHTFKFGGDANLVHEVMINLYTGGGSYSYSSSLPATNFANWAADVFAGQPGDNDPYAGYHYTSFTQVLDKVNGQGARAGADDFWMKMFDGFAEDSWKVTPHLILNAGVRYDIQITPSPGLVNNNYPPLSTKYTSTIKNVNRFQPRLGFSWEAMPGTVVRGGYGVFSALNQGSTYYAMRVENGVVQLNYNFFGCGSTCTAASAAAAGLQFPNVPFTPPGPSLSGALTPAGADLPTVVGGSSLGTQSFHGLDPDFAPPYAQEFELGVEQKMPGKMSLALGYVGTRGMRLPIFVDANLIGRTPSASRTYNVLDASGNVTKQLTVPVYQVSDRAIPALSSFNTGFSVANTWYNSLATTVRRPFANGLEVIFNYTWSRATDTGQVGGANGTFYGGDTPLDPNNPRRDNGLSDIDVRNRMVLSFVYQPKLFTDNYWVRHLVDDWIFSGSEIASAGQPIFASMSGTVFNGGTTPVNGIAGSGGNIYGGAISSGSGAATTGRPPQIGRNSLIGPGFNDFDFRIARDIPIHDSIKLQLVGEAFNLLNHKIVTGVNGTYSTYTSATATSTTCNTSAAAPTGSPLQGCIAPYTGTGLSAFGATSGTNNLLYNSRQMQVSAKLFF